MSAADSPNLDEEGDMLRVSSGVKHGTAEKLSGECLRGTAAGQNLLNKPG